MSESPQGTTERWNGAGDIKAAQNSETQDDCEKEVSEESVHVENPVKGATTHGTPFMKTVLEGVAEAMNFETLDEETTRMVERVIVLRISTKHINLWMRQQEIKRREIGELARLIGFDGVKTEVEKEKDLEAWGKRCTHFFNKKTKRLLFEETDNMVWNCGESEIASWVRRNKVYDEITDGEIEEIWRRDDAGREVSVRLNGKCVWETAKRVCDFINRRDDLIRITTFGEYREVMLKVMRVIKEAHNAERKRRQTTRKKKCDESGARKQRAKTLISMIRRGEMKKEEIERRFDEIFGRGSSQEIEKATTNEKIVERIEDMSRTEEQFEEWEKMRQDAKRRQREDRRLNVFWRRNKSFPKQFGGEEETPDAKETLTFWRAINNKEATEGWKEDRSIRESFAEVKWKTKRSICRWFKFTEEEFEEVLRCTAPWKACGVDSVYSYPIKKCPAIRKAVYQLVKSMVEWKVHDHWDEENNWLLEGRTVLIFKGGDRKDPANYRPITCLPTITKMVTLAIHKRMQKYLFGMENEASWILNRGESGHPRGARKL